MSQCGQRTTWPQAGHWMCVEKPRRFSSRITWPPASRRLRMAVCSWRLIGPCARCRGARRPQVDRADQRAAGGPSTRRGISTSTYWPVCARCQLSSDGVAEPSTSGTAFGLGPGQGHVAGVVPRGGFLLERGLVLFVEHDQPQVRRGGEDRAAGADDHLHLAVGDLLPMPMPLGVAQMAVQHGHPVEPRAEPLDRLRREADFRAPARSPAARTMTTSSMAWM